jgi:chromosome segregation ATPase
MNDADLEEYGCTPRIETLAEHIAAMKIKFESTLTEEIEAMKIEIESSRAETRDLFTRTDRLAIEYENRRRANDRQNGQLQELLARCDAVDRSIEEFRRDLSGVQAGVTMLTAMQLDIPEYQEETSGSGAVDVAWTVLREISRNSSSSVREIQPRRNHLVTKSLKPNRFQ